MGGCGGGGGGGGWVDKGGDVGDERLEGVPLVDGKHDALLGPLERPVGIVPLADVDVLFPLKHGDLDTDVPLVSQLEQLLFLRHHLDRRCTRRPSRCPRRRRTHHRRNRRRRRCRRCSRRRRPIQHLGLFGRSSGIGSRSSLWLSLLCVWRSLRRDGRRRSLSIRSHSHSGGRRWKRGGC